MLARRGPSIPIFGFLKMILNVLSGQLGLNFLSGQLGCVAHRGMETQSIAGLLILNLRFLYACPARSFHTNFWISQNDFERLIRTIRLEFLIRTIRLCRPSRDGNSIYSWPTYFKLAILICLPGAVLPYQFLDFSK